MLEKKVKVSDKFSYMGEKIFGTIDFFSYVALIPFVPSRKIFGTILIVPQDGSNGIFSGFGTVPQDST